jgi:hypothetical protein
MSELLKIKKENRMARSLIRGAKDFLGKYIVMLVVLFVAQLQSLKVE